MAAPASEEARVGWYDGRAYSWFADALLAGVHESVADHLPPGERVLDAACGTGQLTREIAARGRTVVGVDLSADQVGYARRRAGEEDLAGQARFEVADLRTLEVPDAGPYDLAVIVFALHEMPTHVRPDVVQQLTVVADRVVVVDFAVPLPRNGPGLMKRAAEFVAGPAHFTAFRDYVEGGGLDGILAQATDVAVVEDRTIDSGTMRVMTLTAG